MNKYYTGIGHRDNVPMQILSLMTKKAQYLSDIGYTLRSGGARGSDFAFEKGADSFDSYVLKPKQSIGAKNYIVPCLDDYRDLAMSCVPHWHKCNQYARDCHTRNICQIIGHVIDNPIKSDFVLAYTLNGELVGGTSSALKLAMRNDIPIFNMGAYSIDDVEDALDKFLKEVL